MTTLHIHALTEQKEFMMPSQGRGTAGGSAGETSSTTGERSGRALAGLMSRL